MNSRVVVTRALVAVMASALAHFPSALAAAQGSREGGAPVSRARRTLTTAQKADIDAYVQRGMREWGDVPGLSIAVVIGDSAVYVKGYGVRDVSKPDSVDALTIFAIGSNTKSMTSAVVGTLVDEGKMRWDDPVWKHLPSFRLADGYVTKEVTMRDLLSHRVDVENNLSSWYRAPFTRPQLIERLRFLRQEASFRSAFMYNNLMYMAAGEAAAAAAGVSWNTLVRERLFKPLGMTSSYSNSRELPSSGNIAAPHVPFEGKLVALPHMDADNIGPAGSVYSNATDMAQYLRMQIGYGTMASRRVLSAAAMTQIRTIWSPMGPWQPVVPDSNATALGYGFGWLIESFRGHRRVRHNGSIDGFLAEMQVLPDDSVGVVVLSNQMTRFLPEAVANHVLDVVLGLKARDWHGEVFARTRASEAQAVLRAVPRPTNSSPTLPLAQYVGTYSDSLRGSVTVSLQGERLVFSYHPGLSAPMEPWQHNTFRLAWQSPNVYSLSSNGNYLVTFEIDVNGRPVSLTGGVLGTLRALPRASGGPPPDFEQ
ncbi:MAG: serine hydrolase [Phycisphaerae bacterium]|nr:serine hydrolase [Gemmatimonadaceae bacterium]